MPPKQPTRLQLGRSLSCRYLNRGDGEPNTPTAEHNRSYLHAQYPRGSVGLVETLRRGSVSRCRPPTFTPESEGGLFFLPWRSRVWQRSPSLRSRSYCWIRRQADLGDVSARCLQHLFEESLPLTKLAEERIVPDRENLCIYVTRTYQAH